MWTLLFLHNRSDKANYVFQHQTEDYFKKLSCAKTKVGIKDVNHEEATMNALKAHERLVLPIETTYVKHDDMPCLSAKYVAYDSDVLVYYNRMRGFTQKEAIQLALDVIDALIHMHSRGIAHRDIKPENIFIMDGRFYVADFDMSGENGQGHILAGTAGHRSPEMLHSYLLSMDKNQRRAKLVHMPRDVLLHFPDVLKEEQQLITYDYFKADIYALGVTLKMLSRDPYVLTMAWRMTAVDPKRRPELNELRESFEQLNKAFE